MANIMLSVKNIVGQSLATQEVEYISMHENVSLLPERFVSKGTLILTGTADGVIFKPANIWLQSFYLQVSDEIRTEVSNRVI